MYLISLAQFMSLIILTESTKVYRFLEQKNTEEISLLRIRFHVLNEKQITLCFSYKQDQFNMHTKVSCISLIPENQSTYDVKFYIG